MTIISIVDGLKTEEGIELAEDRRVKRTKKAIREAFISLLYQKNLNQITVKDVIDLADISRSTFYLHYTDIYNLYEQVSTEVFDELIDTFKANYPAKGSNDFLAVSQHLLNFVNEQSGFLKALLKENSTSFINRIEPVIIQSVMQTENITVENKQDYAWVIFTVSGVIGLLIDWINGKIDSNKEEMSEIIRKIIQTV